MPLYKATIVKTYTPSGEEWSNVYTISETSIENAMAAATTCKAAEQTVSYNTVNFKTISVREAVPHGQSRKVTINDPGLLSPTGLGGPLPLFNTVRVVFGNLNGKPEQKYLRLAANEANLTLGVWDGEFVSYVQTNYADELFGLPQYVGPSGEAHNSANVMVAVQNRQLGWHRRTRPGFKRGWVPV